MKPRWRKVIHDLWDSKLRTLLVVFSIAVGVFSIGVITGAYEIISHDMGASYAANNPANIELRLDNFDDDTLVSARRTKGVQDAEGRRAVNLRARSENTAQWININLLGVDDFKENKVNLLSPIAGRNDAGKDEVVLDKKVLDKLDIAVGDDLIVELFDETQKKLKVVGIVQDASTSAGDFLAPPLAFTVMDTMETLREPKLYNRVYATVKEEPNDPTHIRLVGGVLSDKMEKNGLHILRTRYSERDKHPLEDTLNAVLGILLALGILIVFLSSSLIANTLSALLNQHLRHIGVMKLIGGRNRQVFAMYLVLILCFAALALLIAVPLGGQGAYALALFIGDKLNFRILGYRIVPLAFVVQIAVGLLVPLVAGLLPVLNGSKITVLRALSNDMAGDESAPRKGGQTRIRRLDWILLRLTRFLAARGVHIPRPFIISLRNTFRKRSRLALTLFTLTMGGAIFISVFNVSASLRAYVEQIGSYFRADVTLDFDRAYRIDEVRQFAFQMDGVEHVEGWQFLGFELLYPDGTVAENTTVLAPPANSDLVKPILSAGRWIRPDDVRKLAVSEIILTYYPDLKPGDSLLFKVNGRKEMWQVVGIFKFIGREGLLAYTPLEYSEQMANLKGRSYSFRIVTSRHDRQFQNQMAEKLDDQFRLAGFKTRQAEAGLTSLDTVSESLDILVTFLLIMAALTAVVGAMGLTGTMGMNVLERTREIGIMRAIGADDRAVMRTVIGEGLVIGLISFSLAIFVSIPLSYLLSYIVSVAIFETPIAVAFTYLGYAIWLGLILILSALGSILPARNAARLTIREVLAYE